MRTLVGDEVDGVGTVTPETPETAEPNRTGLVPSWAISAAVAAAVAVGVALRFYSRSNLWLDEALSVNIARLSLGDLLDALRHDGHPPLYYLLLHYWMDLVGDGDNAVRLLSGFFGVACLPLAWIAGRRVAGSAGARWTVVVVALSPYAIRYSTETRMYSLVMLLVLAGYLLVNDALHDPKTWRLVSIAVITGLLLLSHYWAFWLVAAVGLMLLWRWRQRPASRAATARVVVAVAGGGLLFLPWLSGFLYQSRHTGTPWAQPVRPTMLIEMTLQDLGGGEVSEGKLGGAVILILCLLALFVARSARNEMVLDMRTVPTVRTELVIVAMTAAIGCLVGYATGATYQARYAAVFVPLVLLATAVGLTRIPGLAQWVAGGLFLALSLGGIGWVEYYQRTESGPVAAAVAERAHPGDVVVYCPDQLGPGYSREMPDALVELAYPTMGSPDRVDWVDYADRNAKADPKELADQVRRDYAGHAAFVVWKPSYRTFGQQCEDFVNALGGGEQIVSVDESAYYEPANLAWIGELRG
ncbi:MAG TPA: glycosyltransferase family 39 protein [Acidimicrobiales bacterium]|jgi:hypothetical protein